MTRTAISIVQNAMLHAGLTPVESLEDGTDASDTAKRLYFEQRRFWLSAHPWKFADKRAQLTRSADTPANEWDYQFKAPSDRVNMPMSYFQSGDPGCPPYKNIEFGDCVIYSDSEELWAVYTRDVPESHWPPYFVAFAEHAFAAIIGVALQVTDSIIEREDRMAWGLPSEGRRGGLFAAARFSDGRFAPTRSLNVGGGPLLAARGTRAL